MGWILAVDAGNTVTRLAVWQQGRLGPMGRLPTGAEDYGGLLEEAAARLRGRLASRPQAIGISSVVSGREADLAGLGRWLDAPVVWIGSENCPGLPIAYRPPTSLGTDRIANAVAARERFGSPVIAVDLGTALTIEVVDSRGHFAGGAIFPGMAAARSALGISAAGISLGEEGPPGRVVGDSTEAAVAAGFGYGYPALIEGLLARIRTELGSQAPAVLTGGGVRHLGSVPSGVQAVDPHLTLRGVAAIAAAKAR